MEKEHAILVNNKKHVIKLIKIGKQPPYIVEVDGKKYQVDVPDKLINESFHIKVNTKLYQVELNEIHHYSSFYIKVDDKTFEVQFEKNQKNQISNRNIKSIPTNIVTKQIIPEKNAVVAFMPGRVVLLKVKKGDLVEIGDTLCVLESMKMEIEITAPRSGVVQQVNVSEGFMVNKGELLFLIQ